ncbi:MAG: hypothetical protein GX907_03825 [Clostridiaceae bacterium]|nr:hypothetical protein [Clostridiaceae bacterium]
MNRVKLNFFDDYFIDFRPGTLRRWYTPEFHALAPAGAYSSLCYDPRIGKYRVFYERPIKVGNDGPRLLCLAESTDMKEFVPVYTDKGEDFIFDGEGGVHGASVILDEYEPDPARRYKFCGMTRMGTKPAKGHANYPVVLAFSPDGINWEHRPDLVVHPYTSDTGNNLFYNPCTEEYNLLYRSAYVDRRVSVRTSKDLRNWSEPRMILHPGANYNNDCWQTQYYGMTVQWCDGIFYGLLWRYRTSLQDRDFSKMFGVIEPELVYSYDGSVFYQTGNERPLVERPPAPNPGWAGLSVQDMCLSADGRDYYILFGGSMYVHGTSENNQIMHDILKAAGITGGSPVYRIGKDRFCGLESVGNGGLVITKSLELMEEDLALNYNAACGSVRCALMDARGEFLEGFSFDDCVPLEFSDSVQAKPVWRGAELSSVLNRRLRIAVELNGATLHAIEATARPHIRQRQKSFSDPKGIDMD